MDAAVGVLLVYGATVSFAEAIFAPLSTAAAAAMAPPGLEGRASALFQLAWGVAQVSAPFFLTALLSVDNAVLWLTLAGLSALAAVAVQLLHGVLDPLPVQ